MCTVASLLQAVQASNTFVKTSVCAKKDVPRVRIRLDSLDPPAFCIKGRRQAKAISKKGMRIYDALPDHICEKDLWTIAQFLDGQAEPPTAPTSEDKCCIDVSHIAGGA